MPRSSKPLKSVRRPAAGLQRYPVERVQTGVRMEKRILKVLKGLAEYHDISLGDLLEGIVLHVFDGKLPFDQANRRRIADLKRFYQLELDYRASHRLSETGAAGKASGDKTDRA